MKKHFLVVDDSELNLRVVQTLLEKNGISGDYVTCADHAFTALVESDYDLILMDYLMPGMNGVEATRIIRKMSLGHKKDYYRHIPIIALTAEENTEQIAMMRKAGINDVLTKPIQPKQFREILYKWAPTVHGIDEMTLMGMLDADRSSFFELVNIFCSDVKGKHERINKALHNSDYREYTVEVHKIKSEAKVIGATSLAEAAKILEFAGKAVTGAVPNDRTEEENLKLIKHDTPKVLKALESIAAELETLMEEQRVQTENQLEVAENKVVKAFKPELEKINRYAEHVTASIDEGDYELAKDWANEIIDVVKQLLG